MNKKKLFISMASVFLILGLFLFFTDFQKLSENIKWAVQKIKYSFQSQVGNNFMPEVNIYKNPVIPQIVYESSKKKFIITTVILNNLKEFSNASVPGGGTGFCVISPKKEKIIITARHIPFHGRFEPDLGANFSTSPEGIITFSRYKYKAYALSGNYDWSYGLKQIGIGRSGTEDDIILFQTIEKENKLQCLALQTKSEPGEIIFTDGFSPLPSIYDITVYKDMIQGPFIGKLEAVILNKPYHPIRIDKLFRIEGRVFNGFSGAPVFNNRGEVIGITLGELDEYSYAASAEDIIRIINYFKL